MKHHSTPDISSGQKSPREKWGQVGMSLLGLLIFSAAIWALSRVLAGHTIAEITAEFKARSPLQVFAALFTTGVSYLVLTGYDFLGLRYLNKHFPKRRFALASALGFAFANNLGFFGGAGLRLRLFLKLGLTSFDVAKLITFSAATFWIGFATLGSVLFFVHPPHPVAGSWLTSELMTTLSLTLAGLLCVYLAQGRERWKNFRFRTRLFILPSVRIRMGQMAISSFDWILASSVLFILLPQRWEVDYPTVLVAFLCAQLLGLASNVPGGLGVFETVLLSVLPVEPEHESAVIASLLLFRLIYFVVPLLFATATMGLLEVRHHALTARGYVMSKRVPPKPR